MALLTAASRSEGQGIVRVFRISSVATNDTFVGPSAPKSYWINNRTSNAVVTATESSGTYTFTVSTGTPTIDLHILL